MKINKMIWITAMILLVSATAVFAQFGASLGGFFSNPWVIFAVNIIIVWFILAVIAAFIPQKDGKTKAVVWILTIVIAVAIVWYLTGRGAGYIWQVGKLAGFFKGWVILNTLIIAGLAWFGLGLAGVDPKGLNGKIGLAVLVIILSATIANNIGNTWIGSNANAKTLIDYVYGPERTETVGGQQVKVGGILRPEKPYRLWVFLISFLIFAWFFQTYLNITAGSGKLSWIIAILVAGSLARKGTEIEIIIKIAEVFAFLLILKQIPADIVGFGGAWGQTAGTIIRYLVAATLVGFIFCTAFGFSNIGGQLSKIPLIKVATPDCPSSLQQGGTGKGPPGTVTNQQQPSNGSSTWNWVKWIGEKLLLVGSLVGSAWAIFRIIRVFI